MKKVIVIIPHFNKLILLKECLIHLDNQNYSNFDVLVIDNGSDDGSPEYIHTLCTKDSKYKKILLDKNMGFTYAVNLGINYAINNSYEFSILLNNDAYVEDDFIKQLVNEIEKSNKIFAVSSLMINYHNKNKVDSFGDNYCICGWAFQNRIGENINEITSNTYCFSACGGASIYRNSIFNKIGVFDENFFAYLEDVDISYRAKLYGYKIKNCYAAKCYHLGSATSGSKYNEFKVRLSARNNIYLLYKNMHIIQLILNFFPLFYGLLIKQIFFIYKGYGLDYFFGIFEGFKNIKRINKIDAKTINFFNYIIIEIELFINLIKYILNFIKRHLLIEK